MTDEKIPKLDNAAQQRIIEAATKLRTLTQQFANDFADIMLTAIPEGQKFHILPFYTAFQVLLRDIETEVFVSLADKDPSIKQELNDLLDTMETLETPLPLPTNQNQRVVAGVTWYYHPADKIWKKVPPPPSKDN